MLKNSLRTLTSLLFVVILNACTSLPESVSPVKNFDLQPYLGTWYEIARLDHSFEQGLSLVSANYTMRKDGGVRVLNRGYSEEEQRWEEAEGKAYFVAEPTIGHLKVSFFGPFYASYVIFELDKENYQYAYISGPDHSYLWLLARDKQVSEERKTHFIETATERGFDTSKLIWVKQD